MSKTVQELEQRLDSMAGELEKQTQRATLHLNSFHSTLAAAMRDRESLHRIRTASRWQILKWLLKGGVR